MWWLARGEEALPDGTGWLAPAEAARAARLRFPKRRTEYLLRRLVVKHAVALSGGAGTGDLDPAALAGIEVGNAPDGAPWVRVGGRPAGPDVSVTDRAGWAVCVLGRAVGCDLELVEPRSVGFVRDFLTGAERRFVAGQPGGDARDAAANLIWSAKESALKVLRTGLRQDTREVTVTAGTAGAGSDGWCPLRVRGPGGADLTGWWRRDGRFLLTVVTADTVDTGPPDPLGDPSALAAARPNHSWLRRPHPD
jgi:4'-phosphopantetheinyl transferase